MTRCDSRRALLQRAARRSRPPSSPVRLINSGMPWTASFPWLTRARTKKRARIQLSLQEHQAALSTAVSRLLVQNSENEEQAGQRIVHIYDRVQREVYV